MKKLLDSRITVVFLALGALIALILLTAALRDFSFRPAEPFSFNFGLLSPRLLSAAPGEEIPFWKILLFGSLLLLLFIILFVLLDPEARKLILRRLFRFAMLVLTLWLVSYVYRQQQLKQEFDEPVIGTPIASGASQALIPEYIPPPINPWLVFAVSFGIALALVLFGWFIYSRRPRAGRAFPAEEIAGIAREAQDELQESRNWDDAIVRCYIRMNEVVTAQRGLVRQVGATPAEFALYMERAGLPGEAVRTLTRLFEAVRYGGVTTSPADRDLAAAALSAILHYCEGPV